MVGRTDAPSKYLLSNYGKFGKFGKKKKKKKKETRQQKRTEWMKMNGRANLCHAMAHKMFEIFQLKIENQACLFIKPF